MEFFSWCWTSVGVQESVLTDLYDKRLWSLPTTRQTCSPSPQKRDSGPLTLPQSTTVPSSPCWTTPFTDYATEYNFIAICREQLRIWDGIRMSWFVLLQQPTPAPRTSHQLDSQIQEPTPRNQGEEREKNINTIDWAASNNICFDIRERY